MGTSPRSAARPSGSDRRPADLRGLYRRLPGGARHRRRRLRHRRRAMLDAAVTVAASTFALLPQDPPRDQRRDARVPQLVEGLLVPTRSSWSPCRCARASSGAEGLGCVLTLIYVFSVKSSTERTERWSRRRWPSWTAAVGLEGDRSGSEPSAGCWSRTTPATWSASCSPSSWLSPARWRPPRAPGVRRSRAHRRPGRGARERPAPARSSWSRGDLLAQASLASATKQQDVRPRSP